MAIDYGAMQALTQIFQGTSQARRARRQEVAQLQNEMYQMEQRELQNANLVASEQATIEKSRQEYLKTVHNIPHMRDYVNNFFDEKSLELKGILKEFNGRYSSAMSSGKVLDFRDSIMADLQRTDKYQKAVRSAAALANFDAYEVGKDGNGVPTKGLLSERDRNRRAAYLRGELDEFSLTGLRTEYDAVEAADHYQGTKPDFDEIFSQQYQAVVHNYMTETGDRDWSALKNYADKYYDGNTQEALKAWAKTDMGIAGAYDPNMKGTKEIPVLEQEARMRNILDTTYDNKYKAIDGMDFIISQPAMQQMGVSLTGIEKKGDVQLYSKGVFTDFPESVLQEIIKQRGAINGITSNGDGSYQLANIKNCFDANGAYVDGAEAIDKHTNMNFAGMYVATKAVFEIEGPNGEIIKKEQLVGDTRDKDLRKSLEKQWGVKYENIKMVPTFVATFEHDNTLGAGFEDMRWWDKQVHMQIDPKSGMLERIMDNTGVEESLQESQKSEQIVNKMQKSKQEEIQTHLDSRRDQQMKPANDLYNKQQTSKGEPVTMDFMDDYITAYADVNSSDKAKKNHSLLMSMASLGAENNNGGDYPKQVLTYYTAFDSLLNGSNASAIKFQKAVEGGNRKTIFELVNSMFNNINFDLDKAETLAQTWSNYRK